MYFWNLLLQLENGESMQILHYENGQKYEPHFDYFHDKANQELGGHRVATVLMYLSNVEKGGETIFPNSEVINFLRHPNSVAFISLTLIYFSCYLLFNIDVSLFSYNSRKCLNQRMMACLNVLKMAMQVLSLWFSQISLFTNVPLFYFFLYVK